MMEYRFLVWISAYQRDQLGIRPQKPDLNDYPFCDVEFKNVCLNEVKGTSRKVEFHVAEFDDVWG